MSPDGDAILVGGRRVVQPWQGKNGKESEVARACGRSTGVIGEDERESAVVGLERKGHDDLPLPDARGA